MIISRASLENQPASSNVLNKTIISLRTTAIFIGKPNAFFENTLDVCWPATVHELRKDFRQPSEIILNFYQDVISSENTRQSDASDSTNHL